MPSSTARVPFGVRVFCAAARRSLPPELARAHGRDINETFLDLYSQAARQGGALSRLALLWRELRALRHTARQERQRHRREGALQALRALPRTSPSRSPRPDPHPPLVPVMIDRLLQDVRYTLRSLAKSPTFTAVAVLTLALGIGANTAVFSVVNGVLLAPLPIERPEQLAVVWTSFNEQLPQNWISGPEFEEIRTHQRAFEGIAVAYQTSGAFTGRGEPEQITTAFVSGAFFPVIGTQAQAGRLLGEADDALGAPLAAVVSDGFWQRRLGGDPAVVGQSIELNATPYTVVGILPRDFEVVHPGGTFDTVDVWMPIVPSQETAYADMARGSHYMVTFARMRDGVTLAQAQDDMTGVAAKILELNPDYYGRLTQWGLPVYSLHDDLVQDVRSPLLVLLGAVGFVLLIACVNVANLQLARAAAREREIAVRTALGAGRRRLLQQLLTESLVLGVAGATLGLGVAWVLLQGLIAVAPEGLPRLNAVGIDRTVLAFTLVAGVLTAVLFGLLPGLLVGRGSLVDSLREGGRGASSGKAAGRVRMGLVVAEVALAMVLLVGAGLTLRSFSALLAADPGFRTDAIMSMRVSLPAAKYDAPAQQAFFQDLLERVRALPQVQAAGAISLLPLSGSYSSGTTVVDASEAVEIIDTFPYPFIEADRRVVTAGYFETMGMQLLEGRFFTEADNADAESVVVVDEEFARTFWPEGGALERSVATSFDCPDGGAFRDCVPGWGRVIGVVRQARHYGVGEVGREQAYTVVPQASIRSMYVAARTAGDPAALAAAIRDAVWAIDPDQPVADVATMQQRLATSVAQPRFNTMLLGTFALIAVVLAGVGLYGVIAFAVGQRTTEFGVRMALGASAGSVRTMVLRQGLMLVGVGLLVGVGAAFGLTRMIASMLYVVSPADPITYAGVAATLAAVAVLACLVPATRATRIDPIAALRDE